MIWTKPLSHLFQHYETRFHSNLYQLFLQMARIKWNLNCWSHIHKEDCEFLRKKKSMLTCFIVLYKWNSIIWLIWEVPLCCACTLGHWNLGVTVLYLLCNNMLGCQSVNPFALFKLKYYFFWKQKIRERLSKLSKISWKQDSKKRIYFLFSVYTLTSYKSSGTYSFTVCELI